MNAPTRTALDGGALGRVEIAPAERRLFVDGKPVPLGSRAFDLLAALTARRERIVPKEELIGAVWPGLVVEDNNLQVQISALRKVLGAQAIATVPGRGYQLTLPEAASSDATRVSAGAPAPALSRAPRTLAPTHSPRLLVADDNKVNRLMLARALQLLGHEVASVADGLSALEALRRQPFDLLLLDLEMPEMNGFDLLERRAVEPAMRDVPVIVTSAVEGVAHVARCIELGADDFLPKPVDPVLLRARVGSSLERKFLRDRQRAHLAQLDPGVNDASELRHEARFVEATVLIATLLEEPSDDASDGTPVDAGAALERVNARLTLMVDAIEEHGGRLQQLTGDGVCAVFDAAGVVGVPAVVAVLRAAREMLELLGQFEQECSTRLTGAAPKERVPSTGLSVGIASGEVLLGHVGTPRRAHFLAVGAPVRRAAELAALAGAQRGPIQIDEATRAALGNVAADAVPLLPAVPSEGAAAVAATVAGIAR